MVVSMANQRKILVHNLHEHPNLQDTCTILVVNPIGCIEVLGSFPVRSVLPHGEMAPLYL